MQVLSERYELVAPLGSGGFGTVWEANERTGSDGTYLRRVAIKIPDADVGGELVFRDELLALTRLSHPHIVQLLGFGEQPPFLVMELVDGTTLDQAWASAPVDLAAQLGQLAQIADAIAYAHRRGVVHGDLKPANVLIDPLGVPKVADFGLARLLNTSTPRPPTGTPGYIAPEVIRRSAVSARADIYALGVTIATVVSGEHPFGHGAPAAVLARQLRGERRRLEGLPDVLAELVERCVSVAPEDRPVNATRVAESLRRVAAALQPGLEGPLRARRQDLLGLRVEQSQVLHHPSWGQVVRVTVRTAAGERLVLRGGDGAEGGAQRAAFVALAGVWAGAEVHVFGARRYRGHATCEVDSGALVVLAPGQRVDVWDVARAFGELAGPCAGRPLTDRRAGVAHSAAPDAEWLADWADREVPLAESVGVYELLDERYGLWGSVGCVRAGTGVTLVLEPGVTDPAIARIALQVMGTLWDAQRAITERARLALVHDGQTTWVPRRDHRWERQILGARSAIVLLRRWIAFGDATPPGASLGEVPERCVEPVCRGRQSSCAVHSRRVGRAAAYRSDPPLVGGADARQQRTALLTAERTIEQRRWLAHGGPDADTEAALAMGELWRSGADARRRTEASSVVQESVALTRVA